MPRAPNDSPAMPQPVSGLAIPAKVYITVSRSGQIRRPQRSKSSAVFTTAARFPGESVASRPAASFAPPTPPASASTFTAPSWFLSPAATKYASRDDGMIQSVAREREVAERVRYLSVQHHVQGLPERDAAELQDLKIGRASCRERV